jgi:hypothetical protein
MDKRIAGLLGAAAAITTVSGVQAATPPTTELAPATNYADLLQPVPNPVAALKADDARLARQSATGERVAQISVQVGHHHHHHHHHRAVVVHHHHHHHHHHPAVIITPGH